MVSLLVDARLVGTLVASAATADRLQSHASAEEQRRPQQRRPQPPGRSSGTVAVSPVASCRSPPTLTEARLASLRRLPEGAAARRMDFEGDIVANELVLVMDKFTAADVLREVSVYDTISKAGRYTSKARRGSGLGLG